MNTRAFPDTVAIAAIVVACIAALYGRTLFFGFDYSDYHFIHSFSWTELRQAWAGNWERSGIEPRFYRPLTTTFHAARAFFFGYNPVAYHALSLALFVAAACMFANWLRAMALPATAVMAGVLVFLTHPVMSMSAVYWITNQFHLLQLLLVILALRVATAGSSNWPWLVACQAAVVLIKEDGIMLPFAIAVFWWLRGEKWPRPWLVISTILIIGYLGVRLWALAGALGGYASVSVRNVVMGPLGMCLLTSDTRDYLVASVWGVFALVTIRSLRPLLVPGALLITFNLPLILASWANRWHLLVLCTAYAVANVVAALPPASRKRAWAVTGLLVLSLGISNVQVTNWFAPCGKSNRLHDGFVQQYPAGAVEPAMKMQLDAKISYCAEAENAR